MVHTNKSDCIRATVEEGLNRRDTSVIFLYSRVDQTTHVLAQHSGRANFTVLCYSETNTAVCYPDFKQCYICQIVCAGARLREEMTCRNVIGGATTVIHRWRFGLSRFFCPVSNVMKNGCTLKTSS